MPSLNYETIYKKALSMINDIDLANYTKDDFYDTLCEWLHTASSLPLLRKKFTTYILKDEIMELNFTLTKRTEGLISISNILLPFRANIFKDFFIKKIR